MVNTLHNLSTSGTGTFKSLNIDQVCVFCHTPHNATPEPPLWNRQMSGQTYIQYGSTTLQAAPGQPTGKSRLCLACHDGTVALGAITNPPTGVVNDMTSTFLTGRALLGTDLRDDHPISFVYDSALQLADGELANPATIGLPLESGQLQCTSCHDPHEKDNAPFLQKTTLNGELCITCHQRAGQSWDWATSSHATSTATPSGANPWTERKAAWRGTTVAENACFNCHTPHNAAVPARLVKAQEENTCYLCHNGTVAATNIQAEFLKAYRHPVNITPNASHDATLVEQPLIMNLHAECMDCHNPHAVKDAPPMISFNPSSPFDPNHSTPPNANARIKGVTGVDVSGSPTSDVNFQYELCFKCHGLPGKGACDAGRCPTATSLQMTRLDGVYNLRDKVYSGTAGLVSYHPIEANNPSNNTEVPSLRTDIPLNRTTSLIYCTDCHSGDTSPAAGGTGPDGPHGSIYEAMITRPYTFNPELDPGNFDLCFKCHDEASVTADGPTGWYHEQHLKRGVTCINCHDPHGSQKFNHLINFLTNATYGGTNYQITGAAGFAEPTFIDQGAYQGTCYLDCHGVVHDPFCYDQNGKTC